jgi:N,N'-diacetylchitobiose phosphorylase
MQYGHFDDERYEYVIDRPDTLRSWSNYSGSPLYGSIITNNAGGYSFYRSSAHGRFLRLHFNSIPMDQPGRYFYLRDRDNGDYWSTSWQPVGKPLEQYRSVCRFGTNYTIIESEYSDIYTESAYFVPHGQCFEYWHLKLHNTGNKPKNLSLFTYCEFTSEWNIFEDTLNLQYSAHTIKTTWHDGIIRCACRDNLPDLKDDFGKEEIGYFCWMTLVGGKVSGYEFDRENFIGPYHSYSNPLTVERGYCNNSAAYGGNGCGCLQVNLSLAPGETREFLVLLGVGKAEEEGVKIMAEFGSLKRASEELEKLKQKWHGRLGKMIVETPDEDFNHMINVWNPYNALVTFYWSRAASLVYTGDKRDGFGYRDAVQDILGVLPFIPEEARERLELMISGQESSGGACPEVKPFTHKPGHMKPTQEDQYRSDDCLWLFNSVPAYVAETGEIDFYSKVLPYADKGEDSVLGHLRKALEFNLKRTGAHGLPAGLRADWNDCLKLGYRGESLFVAFQLRYGLMVYAEIAGQLDKQEELNWANRELKNLDLALEKYSWDGKWFVRAYHENGSVIGSNQNEEGKIFLNAQSWGVLSAAASEEQACSAMDAVEEHLSTDYGLMICSPPFVKSDSKVFRLVVFNPGQKENAGIFNHTQSWAVMAECIIGNGKRAYRYHRAYLPSKFNNMAEVREIEPFVHCQSTNSRFSPGFGKSRIPWLSGTASWSFFSASQYILGIKPEYSGLRIDPCIPSDWKGFRVFRIFRGIKLNIRVDNPDGVEKGVVKIILNGVEIKNNFLPVEKLKEENIILVTMA